MSAPARTLAPGPTDAGVPRARRGPVPSPEYIYFFCAERRGGPHPVMCSQRSHAGGGGECAARVPPRGSIQCGRGAAARPTGRAGAAKRGGHAPPPAAGSQMGRLDGSTLGGGGAAADAEEPAAAPARAPVFFLFGRCPLPRPPLVCLVCGRSPAGGGSVGRRHATRRRRRAATGVVVTRPGAGERTLRGPPVGWGRTPRRRRPTSVTRARARRGSLRTTAGP